MQTEEIQARFDAIAKVYDENRKRFIPCFDDYYLTTSRFLSSSIPSPKTILDLGAGTGLLSKFLYDEFPEANFSLVDVSEKMLEIAKERFDGLSNFEFSVLDYTRNLPDRKFDLIASALSIYHLEECAKKTLYRNIFERLEPGGTLVNLDQFNAESSEMETLYESYWVKSIRKSGLSELEFERWQARKALDRENTVDETKALLSDAGFRGVECTYKFMKFAVVIARK